MLAEEIRKLPEKELLDKAREIRERLFNLGFKSATEAVGNPAEATELRRDVARINTVLTERKLKGAPRRLKGAREARTVRTALLARQKGEAAQKKAAAAPKVKKASGGAAKTKAGKSPVAEKKA